MTHKSEDYKISAVKYYLKNKDNIRKTCKIFDCSDVVDLSFVTKRDLIQLLMSDKNIIDNPTIIMGDFNEPSYLDYKYIKWKTSKYLTKYGFVDIARHMYENASKYTLYTVDLYDKNYSPERIDIIYGNKYLKPIGFKNIYNKLSDHIPVVGVFEIVRSMNISGARTKKTRKTNNNTKKVRKL